MKARIGYFVPEFPGQTHIFLWREIQALLEMGMEIDLVSTRLPETIASFVWAKKAQKQTVYLVPFSIADFLAALAVIFQAGIKGWRKCLVVAINAKDMSWLQKLRLLVLVFVAAKLVHIARSRQWSHIHVLSCSDAANIAMFASILGSISYNLSLLGPTLVQYGPNQKQKWHHAAFGMVMSQKLLQETQERIGAFLPEKVVIAPVGVDLEQIKRYRPYQPWQKNRPCQIYSCGRLNPVKGHNDLIEAVALVRNKGFNVRLQIAGEDEKGGKGYRQTLEQWIEYRGMSDFVTLLGAVSEEVNREYIESADIFALASLNEGISVAVMEAMAMQTPVIVTDVGGMSELINNNINGILIPPQQPEIMASAIIKLLENPDFAVSLTQKSREKIASEFHHRLSAEKLLNCLQELGISQ